MLFLEFVFAATCRNGNRAGIVTSFLACKRVRVACVSYSGICNGAYVFENEEGFF